MLRLEGITKRFADTQALNGLSLDVRVGEIFALLGPTGAGKTTTLRVIAGLERADAGRIEWQGREITDAPPAARDVGMVLEGFNLLPTLTVEQNIALPLRSPAFRQSESEIGVRLGKVTADLRIAHLLHRDVETLSGGERQRVAVARALVRRAGLLLLDEPLSALDLKLREALRVELRGLHAAHGATMLYATHDYHGAAAIADRIGVIESGCVRQVGTLDELLADPQDVAVGRFLGSPAMAFFPARVADGRIVFDDLSDALRCSISARPPNGRVQVGAWPEDIRLGPKGDAESWRAQIYATDYRGMDRAVQVQTGQRYFRKAVPLDSPFRQGDPCWFALDPNKVFVFDAETGRRLPSAPGG